ncbi:MAG: thioredoxin-dependent thiol peroxidase [Anaerolineae bacterium]|nr:thioredoxin-dependent thiol peroxidase [Ardenticatenia bacterium]HRA20709.1 thioredoxin-dependent thiol peroxidase [Anaerolineae bacterium]
MIDPGQSAPDFTLPDENGDLVRLADLRGRKVVLYFYPKDDTSGCTAQACGFRDAYERIEAAGALVLGISPDDGASHRKFIAKFGLPFRLLVDADHAVAAAYGAWGEKQMYGRSYEGIIRSHFVIDENGLVAEARVKVSPADSVAGALQAVGA